MERYPTRKRIVTQVRRPAPIALPEPEPDLTIADAIELWLFACQARRHTSRTVENYRTTLSLFVRTTGVVTLAEITPTLLRTFLTGMADQNYASAYVWGLAKNLRAWLNYCVADGLLDKSPMVKMPKLQQKIKPAVSEEDVLTVVKACESHRDKALVLLLASSGVRAAELCHLNIQDVDLLAGTVKVLMGKGQKDRFTMIDAETRRALKRYLITRKTAMPTAPLFASQSRKDGRFTTDGIATLFRKLRLKTGVPVHAHALRRTFATRCLRAGMNIYVLARIMGHTDISVLRQYLDIQEEDLQAAYQSVFA